MDSILQYIDKTTALSLLAFVMILNASYSLSRSVLSDSTPRSLRILFVWHSFDFLIHTIFEGSFLYNCFFTSAPFDAAIHHPAAITNFLGRPDRIYGAAYGDNWATKLWMVYAQADKRWGAADLTIMSLELLTVFGAGPLALYICRGIQKRDFMVSFWMIVLATAELYGSELHSFHFYVPYDLRLWPVTDRADKDQTGFMTFAPEWLTMNQNLDGSNFLFLWVYLVFFNMLWVFLPLYALRFAYVDIQNACVIRNGVVAARIEMGKLQSEAKKQ